MKQGKEKNVMKWQHLERDTYEKAASRQAMFNSKIVNTNAPLTWVRLDGSAAIDLPYVSVRTLMSRGFAVPLDCVPRNQANKEDRARMNAAYSQMSAKDGDYDSPPEDEVHGAREILQDVSRTAAASNISIIDRRLRQVILPKPGAKGGYVSLIPLPASGLSQILFGPNGLVSRHNALFKDCKGGNLRKIRLASLAYGGSNPINASSFTRNIQNSILVPAPSASKGLRRAFALFYKGVRIDFEHDAVLARLLNDYCDFRAKAGLDNFDAKSSSNRREREKERGLLGEIAATVLMRGLQARQDIEANIGKMSGGECTSLDEAVSGLAANQSLPKAVQGLLSPLCRYHDWPRDLARCICARMLAAKGHDSRGREFFLLVLDPKGQLSVLKSLEEEIRCNI